MANYELQLVAAFIVIASQDAHYRYVVITVLL